MKHFVFILLCLVTLLLVSCGDVAEAENYTNGQKTTNIHPREAKANDMFDSLRTAINSERYYDAREIRDKLYVQYSDTRSGDSAVQFWESFISDHPEIDAIIERQAFEKIDKAHAEQARLQAEQLQTEGIKINKSLKALEGIVEKEIQNSIKSIEGDAEKFEEWDKIINTGLNSTSENAALANRIKKKVSTHTQKRFPEMRRHYADKLDRSLFRENIDVHTSGERDEIIVFVGGFFASNANVEDFQTEKQEELLKLRFRKAIYKWYKYDNDYLVYSLSFRSDDL